MRYISDAMRQQVAIRAAYKCEYYWAEHFEYYEGQIIGISFYGVATSRLLNFNQVEKVILRRELYRLGLYP